MKKLILAILLINFYACSSGPVKPTTDICSLEKHFADPLFRVMINGKKINKHWYTLHDAKDVARRLAKENKCMK